MDEKTDKIPRQIPRRIEKIKKTTLKTIKKLENPRFR